MEETTDAKPIPEEIISVSKSVYDELKAKAEANENIIKEAVEAKVEQETKLFKDDLKEAEDKVCKLRIENNLLVKETESYRRALAISTMEGVHHAFNCRKLLDRGLFARIFRRYERKIEKDLMI